MKTNGNVPRGQRLRFAALVRVSTERQEKEGESLRTQTTDLKQVVSQLGGEIVEWYGGQEHATAGFEKREIDRLLRDAAKDTRSFNAVIVAHPDRWSRENGKSQAGLEVFKTNGVRFFIRDNEQDLFDETCRLYLGMSAVIGEYHALRQSKASILNRINRAKRGIPTCGKLPYGRIYDPEKGWQLDEEKRKTIEEIARRYLAGEKLPALAREKRMNHANLHKILTKRCGTEWEQTFKAERLNIDETVQTAIPRLLPEPTIKAIKARTASNKTLTRDPRKDGTPYLLGRVIFCAHCGYAMFGHINHGVRRYYRHCHAERERRCDGPKAWVPAEAIEEKVIEDLFETFGNPGAVKRAIEQATPNLEKIRESENRIATLETQLEKVGSGRSKILKLVTQELISEKDAEKELAGLKEDEARLRDELSTLRRYLEHRPTKESVEAVSRLVAERFKHLRYPSRAEMKLISSVRLANASRDQMTWKEKRALVETVFGGRSPDGKRMGVYVHWKPNAEKRSPDWIFTLHGHFPDELNGEPSKHARASAAIKSALRSRGTVPRGFRSRGGRLRRRR